MRQFFAFGCVFFVCLLSSGVDCGLSVVPANTAVVVGDTAVFSCSTDSGRSVQWILDGVSIDIPPVTIYDGTSIHTDFSDRYSILSAVGGQFDLQLVNTSLPDAGVYICAELNATEDVNASAIFTVLAGEPNCSSSAVYEGSAEGDTVALLCLVAFNGTAWQPPRMRWFVDGQFTTNNTEVWEEKYILVRSWCNFTAELPTTDAYSCETYFTAPTRSDPPTNLSQSVPSLMFNWTSPVIAVLYSPVNTSISGAVMNATFLVNSELSCASSGQPEPAYNWTDTATDANDIESRIIGYGSRFNLTKPGRRRVTCTAYNYIHGEINSEQVTLTINVIGLTIVPENTAVVAGQNATLRCQTNSGSSVQWILDGLSDSIPPFVLFDGVSIHKNFTYRYSIVSSVGGEYNLRLTNTSQRDAGYYMCTDINTTHTASAIFTVIAAEPNCSSSAVYEGSAEGDTVALLCPVAFNGSAWQRPRLRWFLDGQFVTNHTEVWEEKDVLVWSWCNFTAELPTTAAYTCETYFTAPTPYNPPPNLSQTAPSLTLNWTSPVVAILYPPVNTTINGAVNDQSLDINSVLSCESSSVPEPTYSWTDSDSNGGSQVTKTGAQLTLTQPGVRLVTCTASNNIHNELKTQQATLTIHVTGSTSTGLSGGEIAGIVIGTLCGVALLAAGVWYFVYYKRKEDDFSHIPLQ